VNPDLGGGSGGGLCSGPVLEAPTLIVAALSRVHRDAGTRLVTALCESSAANSARVQGPPQGSRTHEHESAAALAHPPLALQ
jgi:hypothetical protein